MQLSALETKAKLYGESTEVAWKRDHVEAMAVCDLEDLISDGLTITDRLNRRLEREPRIDFEISEAVYRTLKSWLQTSHTVGEIVRDAEAAGYSVEGANELRKRTAIVVAMMPHLEQTHRALSDVRAGKGVSLSEAIRALRNRADSGRAGSDYQGPS